MGRKVWGEEVQETAEIVVRLLSLDGMDILSDTSETVSRGTSNTRLTSRISSPCKWTAETPHLYSLDVTLQTPSKVLQKVQQRIGFRKVEIINGEIRVNGQTLLFRGVNRHDHHHKFGRAVPLDLPPLLDPVIPSLHILMQPGNPPRRYEGSHI